jgi:two-component system sensor histidine kinase TctE
MRRDGPLLRRKLLGWLLGPLVLLFLAGGGAGYVIAHRLANDVYNRLLLETADELSLHLAAAAKGGVGLDLAPAARRLLLSDARDELFYRINTTDGRFIAGNAALPAPKPAEGAGKTPDFYQGTVAGKPVWIVAVRIAKPALPAFLLQVAETTRKRDALVRNIVLSIVLPQFLLILVAGLLVRIGIAQGLSPLWRLREAVANRSHLDLSPIGEEDVPGEVRPLLRAVNALMRRLNEVLGFQTRFIADAAHQLRTPVAGLKTTIELAQRETDPGALARSLGQARVSVERLSRLVSQLLSLARNEPGSVRDFHFSAVDLNKLIFDTTMEWVPEAYKKDIDLGFEGPQSPVLIGGDKVQLTELANNLIDNAVRYTSDAGRVTVRIVAGPPPSFSVSDDGPRIPPAERERIFERFHRLLGTPTEGTGLGLAIVREIAETHGAQVDLSDDADGVGNRFTITFPMGEMVAAAQLPGAVRRAATAAASLPESVSSTKE